MKRSYNNVVKTIKHLEMLHETFLNARNYSNRSDYELYLDSSQKIERLFSLPEVEIHKQLYSEKARQMILADMLEYILLARGLFFMTEGSRKEETRKKKRGYFIKGILYFVNMLMSYESITVDDKLRKKFLENLKARLPDIENESLFSELIQFRGKVGLKQTEFIADRNLNRYFDKILPKTAGGLWHELLVYIFLLRNDLGYIVPLLLSQKLFSLNDTLVPPDYLLITKEKDIFGVEVGIKKEIQSGSFSLTTNIPTATIDTRNSRCSDRCPICKKWIQFCDKIIEEYSDLNVRIESTKIKCLEQCDIYTLEEKLNGACPNTKYSRANKTRMINHQYITGDHYHYKCVLKNLTEDKKEDLIAAQDSTAIITHFPYYSGLEMLIKE